jgi:hypothetical protein
MSLFGALDLMSFSALDLLRRRRFFYSPAGPRPMLGSVCRCPVSAVPFLILLFLSSSLLVIGHLIIFIVFLSLGLIQAKRGNCVPPTASQAPVFGYSSGARIARKMIMGSFNSPIRELSNNLLKIC